MRLGGAGFWGVCKEMPHLLGLPWRRHMVCHMNLRPSCYLQLPSESPWAAGEGPLTVREHKTDRLTKILLGEATGLGQFKN